MVRACDYYEVSADYLLGRRPERGPAGAGSQTDPAVLVSTAEVLTQLCLELCQREPACRDLFRSFAGELKQALNQEKPRGGQEGEKGPH